MMSADSRVMMGVKMAQMSIEEWTAANPTGIFGTGERIHLQAPSMQLGVLPDNRRKMESILGILPHLM